MLTDAERARTGIEQLVIDESPGNAGAIVLRDARTELHEQRAGSGIWRLDREA